MIMQGLAQEKPPLDFFVSRLMIDLYQLPALITPKWVEDPDLKDNE